ncbi:hypothetical protein [Aquimarina sp. 2201CG14-23]|uniref:hypothetical protein n=1 Tax=Aquimarina mycalae TaxID=3040073 RepID=UPI0024780050|nr:hypothetical protein [Aquimarina sp. 2201CG14-23]MDH7445608.1 hypothetical protein [Aquimarina sp. 2201CG14-23]
MSFSKTIPFFIIIIFLCIQCKKEDSSINPLLAPENWRKETIEFPLSFASSLEHKGTEYVRFAPGWSVQDSEEYFSYTFLWYIDENPKLSDKMLETEMEAYFDGLMNMVSKMNLKLFKKIPKTKAFFEKLNDHSYAGKVITYDAFTTKKEVKLNIIAEYLPCKALNKHLVFFKISPQQIDHVVWDRLDKVEIDLNCN